MGCVYKITNLLNGRAYIGITLHTAATRWRGHVWGANGGGKCVLAKAIRKYGEFSFDIKTLRRSKSKKQLYVLEQQYIRKFNTKVPFGYNITAGGEGFYDLPRSLLHRARISASKKGLAFTIEHRRNLSKAQIGKKHVWSAAHRASHKKSMKVAASTPEQRAMRSARATQQHLLGKLGRRAKYRPETAYNV